MQLTPSNTPEDFQAGYLTLPYNQEQFQAFIKGLLGSPQTITKSIAGKFEIQMKDLQNFHDLLNQRVTQQNRGILLQLKTQIYFSDHSSVLLSSYEELLSYNEVKPIISNSVRMTWSYLIQFPDKEVPEKQEVELSIDTGSTVKLNLNNLTSREIEVQGSEFEIIIRHTARTWGTDIESLIVNQINSIIRKETPFKAFIHKKSALIGMIVGLMVLASSLISLYMINKNLDDVELAKIANFTKSTSSVPVKVDYLLTYIAKDWQASYTSKIQIFSVLSLVISIVLGAWVGGLASDQQRSFLILTREAKNYSDRKIMEQSQKNRWFWISIFISIVTGVISSYIFEFLTKIDI